MCTCRMLDASQDTSSATNATSKTLSIRFGMSFKPVHQKIPIEIMNLLMDLPHTYMHGPEHHALIPVALFTAYKNAGGELDDFRQSVDEALARGGQVPGGICGLWGSCGAAIGSGIFLSIVLDCSPLESACYGEINRHTARCLERIATYGGPRCCKRNAYVSILETTYYVRDTYGLPLELPDQITCTYVARNKECLKKACPFFPQPAGRKSNTVQTPTI